MSLVKLKIKSSYPRRKQKDLERKRKTKEKVKFYNKFADNVVLEPQELIKPITEDDIRRLRKKREGRKYYNKNATKIKAKKAEYYWRKQLDGATALNKPFKGCNKHHISSDYVIFIPRELHQKHVHSLKNYWRMGVINNAVIEWLVSEEKRDIAVLMKEVLPPELLESEPGELPFP